MFASCCICTIHPSAASLPRTCQNIENAPKPGRSPQSATRRFEGFVSSRIFNPVILNAATGTLFSLPAIPYPASISVAASSPIKGTSDKPKLTEFGGQRLLMSGVHTKLWNIGCASPGRQPWMSQVECLSPSEQCLTATASRQEVRTSAPWFLVVPKLNLLPGPLSFMRLTCYSQRRDSNRLLHIETHPRRSWGSAS